MLGTRRVGATAFDLWQGDITSFACDVMGNAANQELAGGGGVDGAIHRAGGPSILAECREIGSCPSGEAVVTGAGLLPCKHVIHAVGPIWKGGNDGEQELLTRTYVNAFEKADQLGAVHFALPSISTGVYRFPIDLAAKTAMESLSAFLSEKPRQVRRITFVLFSSEIYQSFKQSLEAVFPEQSHD